MDPSSSTQPQTSPSTHHQDSLRAKKRKLEDAFQTLDDAVQGPRTKHKSDSQPSVFRKSQLSRTVYSTLQKYGISKTPKSQSALHFSRSNTAPELRAKTPHLTAILSRVASKARDVFTFKFNAEPPSLLPTSAEYSPSSLQSFLSRLGTFKMTTYNNKPTSIDAVAASLCGWTNDGKDRLVCGLCSASWVVVGREGMNRDAASSLIEKQKQGLIDNHKTGCPWKSRQCDPAIYRVPLKTPTAMVKDVKDNATVLNPLLTDIVIRHPLTPSQLGSLKKTMAYEVTVAQEAQQEASKGKEKETDTNAMDVDDAPSDPEPVQTPPKLSDPAVIASIFGWSLAPPSDSTSRSGMSASTFVSASRSPSLQGTPSRTIAPRAPVASASAYTSISRPGTPTRPASRASFAASLSTASTARASVPLFHLPLSLSSPTTPDNAVVHCTLCQRRVGLWAFAPRKEDAPAAGEGESASPPRPKRALPQQRQFDLLKEHRSYCPYVVKSTIVPTLPPPDTTNAKSTSVGRTISRNHSISGHNHNRSSSSLNLLSRSASVSGTTRYSLDNGSSTPIEGWRAVLAVILRYGMAQRHRTEYDVFGQQDVNMGAAGAQAGQQGEQEVDNVKAMVAGVKEQGGRELLKYVKGLLG